MSLWMEFISLYELHEWLSFGLAILVISWIFGYAAYRCMRTQYPTYDDEDLAPPEHVPLYEPLSGLSLTKEQLLTYNANNEQGKYLVALQGVLYDVTSAPQDFGPKGHFKALAGTDIMEHIKSNARFEVRDLNTCIMEWQNMLEDNFYAAGVLEDELKTELEDKSEYNSANEAEVEEADEYMEADTSGAFTEQDGNVTVVWNDMDATMMPLTSEC
ncbi:membrane steroid-binding protein 2 [Drosophila busckii]|uniref:membrane steroid-binding protein 2 n=1 Tax=Drosophila busckii TaxID=30019 RepID=UPI00083EBD21|nr:membrane steroid-binding protein 2 [Drosophila busckii]